MSGGFAVTPSEFAPAAAQLRSVAGQLAGLWGPVRVASQAVGFGRGDDVLSPLIEVSLGGAVGLVEDAVSSCVQGLAAYADGLEEMATRYAETDAVVGASFRLAGQGG